MEADQFVDVAIVGYGPTAQLLALMLGRAGRSVAVVERWPDLYLLPRAVHYDHEIARLFQASGVIDDIKRIAEASDRYQWCNANHEVLMDFRWEGQGPSGWPVASTFAQPELEAVLDRHVKRLPNVTVRQGWSATALREEAERVELDIEAGGLVDGRWVGSGETGRIRARYLAGADGANSMVRNARHRVRGPRLRVRLAGGRREAPAAARVDAEAGNCAIPRGPRRSCRRPGPPPLGIHAAARRDPGADEPIRWRGSCLPAGTSRPTTRSSNATPSTPSAVAGRSHGARAAHCWPGMRHT